MRALDLLPVATLLRLLLVLFLVVPPIVPPLVVHGGRGLSGSAVVPGRGGVILLWCLRSSVS